MRRSRCLLPSVLLSAISGVAGCGSSSSGTSSTAAPGTGGAPDASGQDDAAPPPDAAPSPEAGATLAARTAAVTQAIATDPACSGLTNYYWEIGDVSGPLASGAVGSGVSASTVMGIASASKLVFGAYVVERFKADLSRMDASAMRMLSGYTSLVYDSCVGTQTVLDCLDAGSNATLTDADVGHFFYNGGHFQKYAVDLGLGGDDDQALAADIKAQVGTELAFTYGSPQLAGGIRTSAADYAAFLRKILAGKLAIVDHLGESPVCTDPATCPSALYSPAAPNAWHYSYGHWVEDDPATGDGAFSSPGAFGFYPWIDATRTYYGILARYSLATQAYVESAKCGAVLRKAFVSGK